MYWDSKYTAIIIVYHAIVIKYASISNKVNLICTHDNAIFAFLWILPLFPEDYVKTEPRNYAKENLRPGL